MLQAPDDEKIIVRTLGLRFADGHRIAAHHHDWPQLVYATDGVMSVETPVGTWLVPHDRAVWIPAGFEHSVRMIGRVRMQTLYLVTDLSQHWPLRCCVITVTPLLREIVLETMRLGMLNEKIPEQARLASVLADQIIQTRTAPLEITFPSDARARRVAARVKADVTAARTIGEWAAGSGASIRTIERLFQKETGLTFGRWLQRLRALHALERLAAGDSVTAAGLSVGYESTSAFIAMFRRVFGTTPGDYFSHNDRI